LARACTATALAADVRIVVDGLEQVAEAEADEPADRPDDRRFGHELLHDVTGSGADRLLEVPMAARSPMVGQ